MGGKWNGQNVMRWKGKTEWIGMQKDKMKWDVNLNSTIAPAECCWGGVYVNCRLFEGSKVTNA